MQPRFAAILKEIEAVLGAFPPEPFEDAARRLAEAPRVFTAGAGRSGLLMRMFAMRLMHVGVTAHAVGEATTPSFAAGDLLILASGSGSTATMAVIAQKAKSLGGRIVLVTYAEDGPLASLADRVVRLPVPQDDSRPGGLAGEQLLGTLFDQTVQIVLDALACEVAVLRHDSHANAARRHANLQ